MDAGRELDRLVAEQVMGWPSQREQRDIPPCYSTDIGATWQVVAKLAPLVGDFNRADGFFHLVYAESADMSLDDNCKPVRTISKLVSKRWCAHFHLGLLGISGDYPPRWAPGKRFCAVGDTAELAICLAALLAVGYPVDA